MARMSVAAFLECVGDDEELQQALVELAAERGFDFTAEELAESERSLGKSTPKHRRFAL